MQFHKGRLFDHVHLRTADMAASENVEAVYHGPAERSAPSVVFTAEIGE